MLAPLRRKPQALPSLRRDHAHERAVQTRLILAAERALEVHLARAIVSAGRQAAVAYRQHGTDAAVSKLAGVERAIGMAVKPSVTATARAFGRRVIQGGKSGYAYLGLETKAFADLDQAIAEHVAGDTAERVVGISDSLREAIRRVIERGLAENLGEEAIAELIVEATAGEIAMARARRIARTEIHNAAMFGQQAAAEASPLAFDKVWLATEDARTRESHAAANGQRVGLMSSFVLDGEHGPVALQYPGDINAPAGEVINCRCVCLYEPSEIGAADGEQMPIEIVTPDDRPADVELPEPVSADAEPVPVPVAELPERDLEARPYEREASEVWAADSALNLQPEGTPRTGSVVRLIGPNAFYFSPDAPEVDRDIAARPALPFGLRRPVLWHVTIPAGAAFPPGLVTEAGGGLTINSGVGAYGLVEMRVTRIDRTTWGQAAPKGYVEIDDEDLRRFIEGAIEGLADRDQIDRQSAQQTANAVGIQIIGRRRLVEDETGADVVPQSVLRALADVTWTKPALARYLQRLLDGSIRDEPEPGEPSTDARVIVVEAEMVLAAAMPEPGETE